MAIRLDNYLDTVEGQLSMRYCRQRKRLLFLLDLEPRSKNAITEEKIRFQNTILNQLKSLGRRYFKAPVALEFDFLPTENDPPAAHTLPKNYLDLLQSPMSEVTTRRKRLVLEDDRQVQYLAVKYRISPENKTPSIWLKVAPYSNLVADAALLHKVQYNELQESSRGSSWSHRSLVSWDELVEEEKRSYSGDDDDDALDDLREHEKNKTFWVAKFGEDTYEAFREMLLMRAQSHLLKTLALSPSELLYLLSPLFSDLPTELSGIHAVSRDNLISPPLTIDLRNSDLKEGESSIFKQFVRQAIRGFRQRFERLFPLRTQVGVTILFQPPATGSIDLDNLARRIIPFVNEELQPPSNLLFMVDVSKVSGTPLKNWFIERRRYLKRMPKHSVTHYQVVQLPRLTNDDEHGFVRLLLESGGHFSTLWHEVEDLVNKWQEAVKRG